MKWVKKRSKKNFYLVIVVAVLCVCMCVYVCVFVCVCMCVCVCVCVCVRGVQRNQCSFKVTVKYT